MVFYFDYFEVHLEGKERGGNRGDVVEELASEAGESLFEEVHESRFLTLDEGPQVDVVDRLHFLQAFQRIPLLSIRPLHNTVSDFSAVADQVFDLHLFLLEVDFHAVLVEKEALEKLSFLVIQSLLNFLEQPLEPVFDQAQLLSYVLLHYLALLLQDEQELFLGPQVLLNVVRDVSCFLAGVFGRIRLSLITVLRHDLARGPLDVVPAPFSVAFGWLSLHLNGLQNALQIHFLFDWFLLQVSLLDEHFLVWENFDFFRRTLDTDVGSSFVSPVPSLRITQVVDFLLDGHQLVRPLIPGIRISLLIKGLGLDEEVLFSIEIWPQNHHQVGSGIFLFEFGSVMYLRSTVGLLILFFLNSQEGVLSPH